MNNTIKYSKVDMFLPPSLTIDTNLINAKQKIPEMNILEKWHKAGLVKIVKTDVMDTEMWKYRPGLQKSEKYPEDMGTGVYGQSRFGHCKYGGEESAECLEEIREILFPEKSRSDLADNELKDVMCLNTHRLYKRDFFVTNDFNHIISKKNELFQKLSIIVHTPSEIVVELKGLFNEFGIKPQDLGDSAMPDKQKWLIAGDMASPKWAILKKGLW